MLRRKILEEYRSVQNQIVQIEEKRKHMPEGKLLFSRSKNNVKWYVSDGHKKVYLSKKNACEVLFTFSKPETGSRMRQEWAEKVPESI